jgi:hypothetical protein
MRRIWPLTKCGAWEVSTLHSQSSSLKKVSHLRHLPGSRSHASRARSRFSHASPRLSMTLSRSTNISNVLVRSAISTREVPSR